MCGCIDDHYGVACGSDGCHCHPNAIFLSPMPDEEVYMSITFMKINRRAANEMIKMLTSVTGLVSYTVYVNDDPDEELDEDDD